MEVADVVIMNDDLMRLPETMALSRRTFTVLWQNITLALGFKAIFLVLTVVGRTSMWEAVFADMGTKSWGFMHPAENSPDRPTIHRQGWIGADAGHLRRSAPAQVRSPVQEWMGCWGRRY